jgi:hypothetical protein
MLGVFGLALEVTVGRVRFAVMYLLFAFVAVLLHGLNSTSFAVQLRHSLVEHDGEVIQHFFPMVDRHGPLFGRLTDRHVNDLQGRLLVRGKSSDYA